MSLAAPIFASPTAALRSERISDILAPAVLTGVGLIVLATFRDYGLSWDDYAHSEYGELLLRFYSSGATDRRALSWVNLYYYGGGFDLLAAALAKVLPFTLFETRRLAGAAVGLLGLFVTWRIARRLGGPVAGLVGLVLLATCPLYYGHMFMNPKDSPFAVTMAILLLGAMRTLDEYPKPHPPTIVLLGVGFGLAFGSRIMGAFGAIELLAALGLLFTVEHNHIGMRATGNRLAQFSVRVLPALVLAYGVMGLIWPWSVVAPLNPLRAVEYFSHFFEKPWQELFGGVPIPVVDMPRGYVPTLFALKLPEIFLALGLAGAAIALVDTARAALPVNQRGVLLLVALAALLPVAAAVLLRPAMYNGIRHFLFVLPPLAALGGLAAARLINGLTSRGAASAAVLVLIAGLALPVADTVRLHPYEYTHFNRLAGGVAHARGHYMLDYWGLSFKQAAHGLLAKLAERHEQKPEGRRWKIAVCGPHRSPEVELGPDFETTWDPSGADFAMMLGEFYCAKLDAPLLVDVVREGVSYARVYDIRGRAIPTLLTRPGL